MYLKVFVNGDNIVTGWDQVGNKLPIESSPNEIETDLEIANRLEKDGYRLVTIFSDPQYVDEDGSSLIEMWFHKPNSGIVRA